MAITPGGRSLWLRLPESQPSLSRTYSCATEERNPPERVEPSPVLHLGAVNGIRREQSYAITSNALIPHAGMTPHALTPHGRTPLAVTETEIEREDLSTRTSVPAEPKPLESASLDIPMPRQVLTSASHMLYYAALRTIPRTYVHAGSKYATNTQATAQATSFTQSRSMPATLSEAGSLAIPPLTIPSLSRTSSGLATATARSTESEPLSPGSLAAPALSQSLSAPDQSVSLPFSVPLLLSETRSQTGERGTAPIVPELRRTVSCSMPSDAIRARLKNIVKRSGTKFS